MNDQYIMYAPNGELQDSIQASGVIDISNLNRRQIKDLATSAAGWSGENGGFSANDILSGQADVQGRFTRHEDFFKRKFNKQLNRNLRHTAKMQEIENAKNGDVTALGRYQNYAKEDAAKVLAPLVAGVPMIGTGVLGTAIGGVKSIYANPLLRFGLDMYGTADGVKNLFTDDGIQKTIRAVQEGDTWGAIKSGIGDVFDVASIIDLPKGINGMKNIENYRAPYRFKYIDNIGDEGTRWKHINDTDVDLTYKKYVDKGIVDPATLPKTMVTPTNTFKSNESLEDFIYLNDEIYNEESKVQWLIDNLKGKTKEEADKFLSEVSNPNSPHYNDYIKSSETSYLKDHLNNSEATRDAKRKIVERGREVEKALNFVADGIHAKNPLTKEGADFIEQLVAGGVKTYRKPKFSFDFDKTGSDYNSSMSFDGKHITMGWLEPGESLVIPKDGTILDNGFIAAHEGAHGYQKYNNKGEDLLIFDSQYMNMTDAEKKNYLKRLRPDSPEYQFDYSKIPEKTKSLLTPTIAVNDHDIELAEGASDAWGTRFNLFDKGISSAALDPNKKYNYFDLLRYKMTPQGMTDRFIRQRGGWWKGWKQQLDALNEVYKNGGKL